MRLSRLRALLRRSSKLQQLPLGLQRLVLRRLLLEPHPWRGCRQHRYPRNAPALRPQQVTPLFRITPLAPSPPLRRGCFSFLAKKKSTLSTSTERVLFFFAKNAVFCQKVWKLLKFFLSLASPKILSLETKNKSRFIW